MTGVSSKRQDAWQKRNPGVADSHVDVLNSTQRLECGQNSYQHHVSDPHLSAQWEHVVGE